MPRTHLTTVLIALSVAAVGYGLYAESSAAQHRRPDTASPQTAQPRSTPAPQAGQPRTSPPPPAQPPDGQNAGRTRPTDAPAVGRAEPRQGPPPRPSHPGHGGAVYYPGPWYGWYGYPWYSTYPWSYPPPVSIAAGWAMSKIRLEVTPKNASVYVDRYYAGSRDIFSTKVPITIGRRNLEAVTRIRAIGWHIVWITIRSRTGYDKHPFSRVVRGQDGEHQTQRRNMSMGGADLVRPCALLVRSRERSVGM